MLTKDDMIDHVNSFHEGWRFHCDFCGEGFLAKCDMSDHANSFHEDWNPHCDICGHCFLTKVNMISHMYRVLMLCLWRRFLAKR